MSNNIENFTKPKVRPYLSDDGVTPITKDQAIHEMLHNVRAGMLAHEMAVNLGYQNIMDYSEKAGKDEALDLMAQAKAMTASANDDPYIL